MISWLIRKNLNDGKNIPILYYLYNFTTNLFPCRVHKYLKDRRLHDVEKRGDYDYIINRVRYYNKLNNEVKVSSEERITINEFISKRNNYKSRYYFDTYNIIRGFDRNNVLVPLFGDITTIPPVPSIVKSRPIAGDNSNSVVMKIDRLRHFMFLHDTIPFREKDPRSLFYTYAGYRKQHRLRFLEMYHNREDICICGNVKHHKAIPEYLYRDKISILDHLKFRYIVTLEGNDVATNLKWVMSSNCVAIMPRPTYETWFMEGTLIPNYHYIEIKADFTDLEEKINFYNENPEKAEAIVENAHKYIAQFQNKEREKIIGLLVAEKYFKTIR